MKREEGGSVAPSLVSSPSAATDPFPPSPLSCCTDTDKISGPSRSVEGCAQGGGAASEEIVVTRL